MIPVRLIARALLVLSLPAFVACSSSSDSVINGTDLGSGSNPFDKICLDPSPTLSDEIQHGDLGCAKKAIDQGASVNLQDADGNAPIHLALQSDALFFVSKDPKMVNLLISKGANVNQTDGANHTPFELALTGDATEIAKVILKAPGFSLEQKSSAGQTPLQESISAKNAELASMLVSLHASLTATDASGAAPLSSAISQKLPTVAAAMIDAGADINQLNNDQDSPLHLALNAGDSSTAKILINRGARLDGQDSAGNSPLLIAASVRNDELARIFVEKKVPLNVRNGSGDEALFRAIENQDGDLSQLLIARGADLTASDANGDTPLHLAANEDQGPVVDALLSGHGVDVNALDAKGLAPLHDARSLGVVQKLVNAGADVNRTSGTGNYPEPPLAVFMTKGYGSVVQYLIGKGANVQWTNSSGETYLHLAIANNALDVAGVLLNAHVDPNGLDDLRATPLFYVTSAEAVQILVGHGARTDALDKYLNQPLERQIESYDDDRSDIIAAFLKAGADPNYHGQVDPIGTYLMIATSRNATGEMSALIKGGANPNLRGPNGDTPIHYAVSGTAVRLLAQSGADINLRDGQGRTRTGMITTEIQGYQDQIDAAVKTGDAQLIKETRAHYQPQIDGLKPLLDELKAAGGVV